MTESRRRLGKSGLSFRMPGEGNFHAFRQESFATALTTPRERGPATFGAHAGTKTVLLFAGPF